MNYPIYTNGLQTLSHFQGVLGSGLFLKNKLLSPTILNNFRHLAFQTNCKAKMVLYSNGFSYICPQ